MTATEPKYPHYDHHKQGFHATPCAVPESGPWGIRSDLQSLPVIDDGVTCEAPNGIGEKIFELLGAVVDG